MLQAEEERRVEQSLDSLNIDSDAEQVLTDEEYHSSDELTRNPITYDIDTMFEIVYNRDYLGWSLDRIHHRWRQIHTGSSGRTQLTRFLLIHLSNNER